MANYDLSISCKGISDATPRGSYTLDIDLEVCDIDFISDISAEDIVANCDDVMEILDAIDDADIFSYLESQGIIFNKG